MKQLRRAGVCHDDLLYYYQAVVRPVLKYASPSEVTTLRRYTNLFIIIIIIFLNTPGSKDPRG